METRKKAVMDSVRSEIALANAQELMNVRGVRSRALSRWLTTPLAESEREMLPEMHYKARNVAVEVGGGVLSMIYCGALHALSTCS